MNPDQGTSVCSPVRILFRSLPSFGHLYPLMPLAEAARAAGHDVVFSTAGHFVGRLETLGFQVVPAGVPVEESISKRFGTNPPPTTKDGKTHWAAVSDLFALAAIDTADDLIGKLPDIAPDVVIHEQVDYGAAVAAAIHWVPAVSHSIVRAFPPDVHDSFVGAAARILHHRYGLHSGVDIADPDHVIDSYPPSLQLPSVTADARRMTMRPRPFSEPSATVPDWVTWVTGRLVYVTVGTVPGYFGTLETLIEGLAELSDLDLDVLVATGAMDAAALGRLPPRVRVEPFVNFVDLLPHLDLIVHHGGCGTTTGAWVHGVPQLVWPHGADHFANADAVAASGSGLRLDVAAPSTVAKLAAALLLDPSYRESASAVRDEIAAMPSPEHVLPELLARVS